MAPFSRPKHRRFMQSLRPLAALEAERDLTVRFIALLEARLAQAPGIYTAGDIELLRAMVVDLERQIEEWPEDGI
jgi:hypothetical protein